MTVIERFLKYVAFDTQSDESTGVTPSTEKQMVFARYLKTELEDLGLKAYNNKKQSTGIDILEELFDKHEIVPLLIRYRKIKNAIF